MKLHKDGTIEGTPQEIADYCQVLQGVEHNGEMDPYSPLRWRRPSDAPSPLFPNPLQPTITCGETKSIVEIQLEAQKNMKSWERNVSTL